MREKYRGRFQGRRMMHINRKYCLRKHSLTSQTVCHNSSESRWDAGQVFKEENLHGECRFTQISSPPPTLRCHTSLSFRAEYLLPPPKNVKYKKWQIVKFWNSTIFSYLCRNLGKQRCLCFFGVLFVLLSEMYYAQKGF